MSGRRGVRFGPLALLMGIVLGSRHVEGAAPSAIAAADPAVPIPPVEMRLIEAGQSLPIDLGAALALAAAKNLDVLAARARLAEARGESHEALGAFFPQATASFTVRRIDGEIQASFGELDRRSFSTVLPAAGVELELNPGQALFDLLAARRQLDAAGEDVAQVSQEVLASAAVQYFALEDAQARVTIAEEALEASRELARVGRDRERQGAGLKVDVLRAEARLAADEGALEEARQAMRLASVRLALTLKLDPAVMLFPADTTVRQRTLVDPAVPLATLAAHALARRPDLMASAARVAAADHRRRATWAEAVGPTAYGRFEESAIGRNVAGLDNRQIYGGFLGFTLAPAAIGRLQAIEARVEQARIARERRADGVVAEVIAAREDARTAAEQIQAALRGLQAADAAFDLSEVRFKGGVGIGLEVLDAQAARTRARTSLVGAIVAYDAAEVALVRALGTVSAETLVDGVPEATLVAPPARARERERVSSAGAASGTRASGAGPP